ncbi:glycoside hydrolase family 2 TIM barrel-domain containing protein [Streptomyces scabiei]|uniref:glycoside hydrolase family 2 TIM barrel-domain containing protein n=1 Tax=Streptomyces scabiei TaxID=1930 RepID=UPI0029C00CE4|nr:glycoside hydrolase family 2 TIM barrel-domain containing protein [Streptomyces scabiei]
MPFVFTEFAHAMGSGALTEHMRLCDQYPPVQGGFVWEWRDQGLRSTDGHGREFWVRRDKSPSPARIGLHGELPGEWSRVSWFGSGPGETCPDSRQAARVGVFRASMEELRTPYVRPQDNGNRADVRQPRREIGLVPSRPNRPDGSGGTRPESLPLAG